MHLSEAPGAVAEPLEELTDERLVCLHVRHEEDAGEDGAAVVRGAAIEDDVQEGAAASICRLRNGLRACFIG